jgi:ABC-type uncharacterized transport system permease subunit
MLYSGYAGYGDSLFQNQIDQAQADIQSRVAQFLALKSTLATLKTSLDPNTSSKANVLYVRQGQLEDLLTKNLDKLKKVQAEGLSFSSVADIASIANFALAMESQISDVNTLADASRGVPVKKSSLLSAGLNMKTGIILLGGLVLGFVAYRAVK